jgi:hypothetical protein
MTSIEELRVVLTSLSPSQQVAVEALVSGSTHSAAAKAAGVSRETVSRWVGHHPAVRAAIDVYRSTMATEQAGCVQAVRSKALAIVLAQLDSAGLADALAVIRALPVGPAPSALSPLTASERLEIERAHTISIMPEREPSGDPMADSIDDLLGVAVSHERERANCRTVERVAAAAGLLGDGLAGDV